MRGRGPFFRKAPSLALLPGKTASREMLGERPLIPVAHTGRPQKDTPMEKHRMTFAAKKICPEQNALGSKNLIIVLLMWCGSVFLS